MPTRIALLAGVGAPVEGLLADLESLDCEVTVTDALATPGETAEVLVVAADGEGGWYAVDRLRHDPRPLLVVSDEPRRRMMSLSARAGQAMMISGAGGPAALQVALSMWAGLEAPRD